MEYLEIEKTIPVEEYIFLNEMIYQNKWFNNEYATYTLNSVGIIETSIDENSVYLKITFEYE